MGKAFVAVYELGRHFGGPEEGGWWWTSGELVHVEGADSEELAYERCDVLREGKYKDTADLYSVSYRGHGAYEIRVVTDGQPVESFPDEVPQYS